MGTASFRGCLLKTSTEKERIWQRERFQRRGFPSENIKGQSS